MSGIKDYVTKLAQETAIQAVNIQSAVIQTQMQQAQPKIGFMSVQSVDFSQNPATMTVLDTNTGYTQTVTYLGNRYPYPGQLVFVNNGYVQ